MIKDLLERAVPTGVKTSLRKDLWMRMTEMMPYRTSRSGMQSYLCDNPEYRPGPSLPVPPRDLWLGYGETSQEYLSTGMNDVQAMERLLNASGTSFESSECILELGCAAGRMIRWLHPVAEKCEIWGTDIDASSINWCQQHLSPPFHFATTTTIPSLPFEDRYFGLVYAGSVFTHIDDLADAWFLELRRVLRRGGKLYVTIQDRRTIEILNNEQDDRWWVVRYRNYLRSFPEYENFSRSNFGMFSLRRFNDAQVFYDIEFLTRKLEPFFRVRSVTEEAYGFQSGMVLERV